MANRKIPCAVCGKAVGFGAVDVGPRPNGEHAWAHPMCQMYASQDRCYACHGTKHQIGRDGTARKGACKVCSGTGRLTIKAEPTPAIAHGLAMGNAIAALVGGSEPAKARRERAAKGKATLCVCGHNHGVDVECAECGCDGYKSPAEWRVCSWCGGEGYTGMEEGPCSQCRGNRWIRELAAPAKPRGGARKGAGRKPEGEEGERAETRGVRLYPSTWALLERLAELEGCSIREVIEDAAALLYNTPESERDLRKPEI